MTALTFTYPLLRWACDCGRFVRLPDHEQPVHLSWADAKTLRDRLNAVLGKARQAGAR